MASVNLILLISFIHSFLLSFFIIYFSICAIQPAGHLETKSSGFRQVLRMNGDTSKELSSGVALPPPDDEFVSEKELESRANTILPGRYDSYEGVIIDHRSLPSDASVFKKYLMASIAQWRKEVLSLYLSSLRVIGIFYPLQCWISLVDRPQLMHLQLISDRLGCASFCIFLFSKLKISCPSKMTSMCFFFS
jgi:hypothetical protein